MPFLLSVKSQSRNKIKLKILIKKLIIIFLMETGLRKSILVSDEKRICIVHGHDNFLAWSNSILFF